MTDGIVLRTLADYQPFTLRAVCQAVDRSVVLNQQALLRWAGRRS